MSKTSAFKTWVELGLNGKKHTILSLFGLKAKPVLPPWDWLSESLPKLLKLLTWVLLLLSK